MITDDDGEPIPDRAVVDAARNTSLKTVRTRMDLLGLAAPRKSMSLQMTAELDSENETLQAQVAEVYQACSRNGTASSPIPALSWPRRWPRRLRR